MNISIKIIRVNKGEEVLINNEDYSLVSKYNWFIDQGYARSTRGDRTLMHRLIMNAPKGLQVDHINGNRLDNRRENLRICTNMQNSWNLKPKKGRKYKGIARYGRGWRASIKFNYKNIYIGIYDTEIEAAKAYDEKAKQYFGEFARLNFE